MPAPGPFAAADDTFHKQVAIKIVAAPLGDEDLLEPGGR